MSIASVRFVNSVPVLGTSLRHEQFDAVDGWIITLDGVDVVLYRAPAQNIAEVPAFRVRGMAYCVPASRPWIEALGAPAESIVAMPDVLAESIVAEPEPTKVRRKR